MAKSNYSILLVEDEDHMIAAIEMVLGGLYAFRAAHSVTEARSAMLADWPDLLLLDLRLPDESGTVLLKEIRKSKKALDVIVITGSKDVGTAVEVVKLGAIDYVQKPFEKEDLLLRVQLAHEHWKLATEVQRLRSELYDAFHFRNIIGKSPLMLDVLAAAKKMARSETTVLITGESGTGKELIARAIHCDGARRDGPFVAVNCAQFSGTLLETELFGHEKGAFTGATAARKGRFELAGGGTLFLDEVGNTSLAMQSKVLRIVETKEFERVGGESTIKADFRLVAATNADLEEDVRRGRFREDLYYRLNVLRVKIPPLRDRKEDIPLLCDHFIAKHRAKTGRNLRGVTPEAMSALTSYDWRGNVRELQNVIEMSVALEDGDWISTTHLPPHVLASIGATQSKASAPGNVLDKVLQNFERSFLVEQLRAHGWNHRRTAVSLGVHRNTIENKVKKYGIRPAPEFQ